MEPHTAIFLGTCGIALATLAVSYRAYRQLDQATRVIEKQRQLICDLQTKIDKYERWETDKLNPEIVERIPS